MKIIIYSIALTMTLAIVTSSGCKKTEVGTLVSDKTSPGPITNLVVENLNGAAKISFKLPLDKDLLYIKAQYTTPQGKVRATQVSRYVDHIVVNGFGDTGTYEVKLFAVDRGENVSTPVSVLVHPKMPSYLLVRDSLNIIPDFGGINISFKNVSEGNIAIVVLTKDSLGRLLPIYTKYTNARLGNFSTRGLASKETKFGIYVRDRWGNISDTVYKTLKPLYEELIDRTHMRGVILPTDAINFPGNTIEGLFDGNTGNTGNYYHSNDDARMPQWFTYDMGVGVKLSRMSWFMREGWFFMLHNPRNVEIWGSNNPDSDGSFNNWVLLATHEQIKPSGLPYGQLSNADNEAALAGESVIIPLDAPKVRYIRFKTLRNWSDGTYVNFTEIRMWGNPL